MKACRLAVIEAKLKETTMHVEACFETSRDGGSNPPASTNAINTLHISIYGIFIFVIRELD